MEATQSDARQTLTNVIFKMFPAPITVGRNSLSFCSASNPEALMTLPLDRNSSFELCQTVSSSS